MRTSALRILAVLCGLLVFSVLWASPAQAAPGSFSLSGSAYCNTSPPVAPAVQLSWSAASGATSYTLYRNGSVYASGITQRSYDNNANVTAGQSYTYFVRAINSSGSTDSNTITVSVPSNVCSGSQAPGNFSLSGHAYCNTSPPAGAAVQLSWSSSSGATSYTLYRNGSQYASGITQTSYDNNANVNAGQSYTYFVRASNSSGSTDSNTITVSVPSNVCAGSQPPGNFSLSGSAYCNTSPPVGAAVQLSWSSSSGATSYTLYRNGSQYASGITQTSYDNNANVTAGQSYTYFVRATNSNGSTDSNTITVSVPSNVCSGSQAPGNFTVTGNAYCNTSPPAGAAVQLSWSSSSGATSYTLYRNGSQYASGITQTSYDNNANVTAGQSYTYFVRATNSNGSTDSNTITVSVPSNVCSGSQAPGSFTVSGTAYCNTSPPAGAAVQLSWSPSSGAASYTLYRNGSPYASGITQTSYDNNANVTAGQTYTYFVRATNSNGNTDSNTITVSVPSNVCGGSQAPGSFTVSGTAYCNTSPPAGAAVQLSWSSSSGAASYTLYRNGAPYASGITQTSYDNNANVTAGQSYTYFVRASNSNGNTDSNTITVSVPSNVCGGSQGPGSFTMSGTAYCNTSPPAGAAVQLSWSSSSGAASYTLYRNGSPYASGITQTSYDNNSNVTAGQTYTYFVRATNGSTSTDSNTITVSVPSDVCADSPAPPGSFTLSANPHCNASSSGPAVQLSWSLSSGAKGYTVYRNGSVYASGLTQTGFDNSSNVTAGQTYTYFVRASNAGGNTDSNTVTLTVPVDVCGAPQPPGPFTLSGSVVCSAASPPAPIVKLSWSSSQYAQSYQILRNGSSYGGALPATTTAFDNTDNLSPGSSYTYSVRASNVAGNASSNSITIALPTNLCAGPTQQLTVVAIDPYDSLLTQHGLVTDPNILAAASKFADGAAADGATLLILRAAVSGPGKVHFSLVNYSGPLDGSLSAIDGTAGAGSVDATVTRVDSGQYFAFAVYQAPADFSANGKYDSDKERNVSVRASYGSSVAPDRGLRLVRPPVVLVHGLWSGPSTFTFPLARDPRFNKNYADYESTNASHFALNVWSLNAPITKSLGDLRSQKIAATQVDIVAHSMGGILAREWIARPGARNFSNFSKGDVHKLITIDTPHFGSGLANILNGLSKNSYISDMWNILRRDYLGPINQGAMEDLSQGSSALQALAPTPVPSHALEGTGGSDLSLALLEEYPEASILLQFVSLWALLRGPDAIFHKLENDLLVDGDSQRGGLASSAVDVIGGADGLHIRNTHSTSYSNEVVDLLNQSVSSPEFSNFSGSKAEYASGYEANVMLPLGITQSLTITSPPAGLVVHPGDHLQVTVQQPQGLSLEQVLLGAPGIAMTSLKAPFRFDVTVPLDAAAGDFVLIAAGRKGDSQFFTSPEVKLTVAPAGATVGLRLQPANQVNLYPGASVGISVLGVYQNGATRDLSTGSSGTRYSISDPTIAGVSADGLVTALSPGEAVLNVANGAAAAALKVSVIRNCEADDTTLCLSGGRFKVKARWKVSAASEGIGHAVPMTSDTGYFWFFGANNVEVVTKVLDARAFNKSFWVFYGALSNVEYWITVTDTITGSAKTYHNPASRVASVADTSAFVVGETAQRSSAAGEIASESEADPPAGQPFEQSALGACGGTVLCLDQGRFKVSVSWQTATGAGMGSAVPLTTDTGYFWFFDKSNVELVIKVLDGRAFNGKFWLFYGALSDVEYTVTVTDTFTGQVRTYHNPAHKLASVADTSAF